jgi:hypothetical protein
MAPPGAWGLSSEIGLKGFNFHVFHLNPWPLDPLNPFVNFHIS